MSSSLLEKLIDSFMKFPGIGPRQAKRFAYFLAAADGDYVKSLGESILQTKGGIIQCVSCFRFFVMTKPGEKKECPICSNINRDKSLLMVVERDVDFESIEKAGVYDGKYFILGGTLGLDTSKAKNQSTRFKQLFDKVKQEKQKEIILATSATVEGENTGRYVEKILEPLLEPLEAKVTRLGRGLSTGTELEYIDTETFGNALKNRK